MQATQAGRWGKVKALQRLLTHSYSGKVVAVRRVTENPGKRTPGVDQVLWNTPAKKATAVQRLRQRGYHAHPLRRVYIAKRTGTKRRPLGILVMADRAMQALYLLALDPVAEATSAPHSYGFRLGRSPADAVAHCFTVLSNRYAPQWIFEGDIRACFDALSHDWLLAHVPMDKRILQQWLTAGFMEQHLLHPTTEGVPQGGPLSSVLANLTLTGLEPLLRSHFPQSHAKSTTKVNTIRFADDFIITGASREVLEQEVRPLVEAFLGERGLELSAEKTVVTHITEGFDFLGQNVRKYDGKLLIKPSKHSVKTLVDKVRTVVKARLQAKTGNLICQLNPLLRGWAQYHRHVVSKETFAAVDAALTDIKGLSARAMLEGIIAGEEDVALLADLSKGRMCAKRTALEQALTGRVRDYHRFLLTQHLTHLDFLDEQIAAFSAQIAATIEAQAEEADGPPPVDPTDSETAPAADDETAPARPVDWVGAVELLDTIPGVGRGTAELIIAEVGTDMQRFGSAAQLASWANVCPGNNESAGKRRSGTTGRGNGWLRSGLVQAAQAAVQVKDSHFARVYRRLVSRRGAKKAIMAVAHRLLIAVYYMLLKHEPYRDPGTAEQDERRKQHLVRRMQQRIERLGYAVTVVPMPAQAA